MGRNLKKIKEKMNFYGVAVLSGLCQRHRLFVENFTKHCVC